MIDRCANTYMSIDAYVHPIRHKHICVIAPLYRYTYEFACSVRETKLTSHN